MMLEKQDTHMQKELQPLPHITEQNKTKPKIKNGSLNNRPKT